MPAWESRPRLTSWRVDPALATPAPFRYICLDGIRARVLSVSPIHGTMLPHQALAAVEAALTPWLQGVNADALLYDKVYGGVVSTNGVADPYGDYGSGTP